jgi:hypothetical protein
MPDTKAAVAEWLISRFTERSRAASIVGDLLEVTAKQGSFAFWSSVAGVVLTLTWRHLAAFAVALFCLYLNQALTMPPHLPPHGLLATAMHQPHSPWMPSFMVLASASVFLSMAAPYAVICYGLRDRFAQLAVALFIPLVVFHWFWSIPAVAVTSLLFAAGILIFSVSFAVGRRALLALILAGVLGYVGLQSTLFFSERFLDVAPPSVTTTVFVEDSIPFFVALTVVAACAWTHHLLLNRKDPTIGTPATIQNS